MKLAMYQNTLMFAPSFFIMIRLYFCAFMSMCVFFLLIILVQYSGSLSLYPSLNSRVNLREALDGPGGVAIDTFIQFKTPTVTAVSCDTPDTTDVRTKAVVPKSLPPVTVFSDMSLSDSVITFDREKYPVTPLPEFF